MSCSVMPSAKWVSHVSRTSQTGWYLVRSSCMCQFQALAVSGRTDPDPEYSLQPQILAVIGRRQFDINLE